MTSVLDSHISQTLSTQVSIRASTSHKRTSTNAQARLFPHVYSQLFPRLFPQARRTRKRSTHTPGISPYSGIHLEPPLNTKITCRWIHGPTITWLADTNQVTQDLSHIIRASGSKEDMTCTIGTHGALNPLASAIHPDLLPTHGGQARGTRICSHGRHANRAATAEPISTTHREDTLQPQLVRHMAP